MSASSSESDQETDSVRIDQWAWAVRLLKTRQAVSAACKKSQLLVNGQRCKAARRVRVGDMVELSNIDPTRRFEVVGLLTKRVGVVEVAHYCRDLTTPEAYDAARSRRAFQRMATPVRAAGAGRPTKRDRRDMDQVAELSETPAPTFEE